VRSAAVRIGALVAAVAVAMSGCADQHAGVPRPFPQGAGRGPCAVTEQTDVPATMRDGTVLRADVYRPRTTDEVPVILMRTQYGKSGAQVTPERYQPPDWFASHCYLVVIQDVRGQGTSGGTFSEFTNDMADGYDSVEWAAALPGSNGKVGMYGSSYVGATQWLAAVTAPPHLVTIVPANTASDYYDGWTYEGGEFRLAFVQPWAIGSLALGAAKNRGDQATVDELTAAEADPTRWMNFRPFKDLPPMQPRNPAVAPWYFDWIRHSTRDDFWSNVSIRDRYASVKVPVLDFEGWYDAFLAGGVENFTGMVAHGGSESARANQRLVIGPWDHVNWGRPDSEPAPLLHDVGAIGNSPINDLMVEWFDHFLKGRDNGAATDGCRQMEVGDELAAAADAMDDLLPVGRRWDRRPQGPTRHECTGCAAA
jgi:putative CocE/NonD family hydrolase